MLERSIFTNTNEEAQIRVAIKASKIAEIRPERKVINVVSL